VEQGGEDGGGQRGLTGRIAPGPDRRRCGARTRREGGDPTSGPHRGYAQWLSRKTGQRYRLLSETEWEFAARAGTTTRFSFDNDDADLCTYANVADRTAKAKFVQWTTADCADGHVYTAPVRSFKPSRWSLYDLHGNVCEWVQDCKRRPDYTGAPTDGSSVEEPNCSRRRLRGSA
jgi:formylglycine-generating enzyme required for sulfatase activity